MKGRYAIERTRRIAAVGCEDAATVVVGSKVGSWDEVGESILTKSQISHYRAVILEWTSKYV